MSDDMLNQTIEMIDAANADDPNTVQDENGKDWPKELLYSHRMTDMLLRFVPDADQVAQISIRAQHIERWKTPRDNYPMDRKGYHQWRTGLYQFHGQRAADIMREVGYDDASIERVQTAVSKQGIKTNPDTQLLEDIADLTFIEHYMLEFAGKHPEYSEEKWIEIIKKTWRKMSGDAQAFALGGNIRLPEPLIPLIQKSVG
jgi:hypothetical protein